MVHSWSLPFQTGRVSYAIGPWQGSRVVEHVDAREYGARPVRRRPRPRLACPNCGGAPQVPRDLRQEVRCSCGLALRLAWVPARAPKPNPTPPAPVPPPSAPPRQSVAEQLDGAAFARPVPIHRGDGAARQRQWGAATDTPVKPGDRLLIVARNGTTRNRIVAAVVSTAGNGHLVTLAGAQWEPDPMHDPAPRATELPGLRRPD